MWDLGPEQSGCEGEDRVFEQTAGQDFAMRCLKHCGKEGQGIKMVEGRAGDAELMSLRS